MLQPDAFCEHTLQQNVIAAGDPPLAPLGELTALSQTSELVLMGSSRRGGGEGGRVREREERGREGWKGR